MATVGRLTFPDSTYEIGGQGNFGCKGESRLEVYAEVVAWVKIGA